MRYSAAELDAAEAEIGLALPRDYRRHLEVQGSGVVVDSDELYLELWDLSSVVEVTTLAEVRDHFPQLVRFGGDGSREHLAFDYRTDPPRIVLVDITATADDDLLEQALTFDGFIAKVLREGLDFGIDATE